MDFLRENKLGKIKTLIEVEGLLPVKVLFASNRNPLRMIIAKRRMCLQ